MNRFVLAIIFQLLEPLALLILHCPAPFLGLTVRPYEEPCGSVAGFDFLTVKVIQIGKKKKIALFASICASGW